MASGYLVCFALLMTASLEPGSEKFELATTCGSLEVFTYRPESYRDGPLIVICHGILRNAEEYRDHARELADRFGAIIAAPRFPDPPFPLARYQHGGLVLDGKPQPLESTTWTAIPEIVDEIRRRVGRPKMPYYLLGHSGGAQFLIRLAAFLPTEASRIVIANPGTYLTASREAPFPYGFGNLPESLSDESALKRFLRQPITLYLAENDLERDEYLDKLEWAEKQGRTRFERGRNAFLQAQRLAKEKGWEFGWRMVLVPKVGHDHQAMFDHPLCKQALFGVP